MGNTQQQHRHDRRDEDEQTWRVNVTWRKRQSLVTNLVLWSGIEQAEAGSAAAFLAAEEQRVFGASASLAQYTDGLRDALAQFANKP
eukprot:m51a1_g7116 hypothetical protein (87) ;mRNA; r:105167-105538